MNVEQAITHLRYRNVTNKERFTEAIDVLENEINSQKTEIERLKEDISTLNDEIYAIGTSKAEELADELTKAQTEAIKEFAERLKGKALVPYGCLSVVCGCDIDNLVKEMAGE